MPIQIIDNFEISVPKPIDNRMLVGPGHIYTTRDSLPLIYPGMRVYDLNDNLPYVYNSGTWSSELAGSPTQINLSTTDQFVTFVAGTSGMQVLQTSNNIKYNPGFGQLKLSNGTATRPAIAFTGSTTNFNTGLYRAGESLGFSVNGGKRFEISQFAATASARFFVRNSNATSTNRGSGNVAYTNPTGLIYSETFLLSTQTLNRLYNLSPTQIVPGISFTTVEDTALEFINNQANSIYLVRDSHFMRTESNRGMLRFGSQVTDDQFSFYMSGFNTITDGGAFDYAGGGLKISNNISVGASSRLSGTVSVLKNLYLNDNSLHFRAVWDSSNFMKFSLTPYGGYAVDGVVIAGYSSGILGTFQSPTQRVALHWNSSGNVGIGTASTATSRLSVVGSSTAGDYSLLVRTFTGGNSLVVKNNGNVGIGTNSPLVPLQLVGNSIFNGFHVQLGNMAVVGNFTQYSGNSVIGTSTVNHVLLDTATSLKVVGSPGKPGLLVTTEPWLLGNEATLLIGDTNHYIRSTYAGTFDIKSSDSMKLISGSSTRIFLNNSSGYVGIGTESPTSPLTVNGNIRTDYDFVTGTDTAGWINYPLPQFWVQQFASGSWIVMGPTEVDYTNTDLYEQSFVRYKKIGKTVIFQYNVRIKRNGSGNIGLGGAVAILLPFEFQLSGTTPIKDYYTSATNIDAGMGDSIGYGYAFNNFDLDGSGGSQMVTFIQVLRRYDGGVNPFQTSGVGSWHLQLSPINAVYFPGRSYALRGQFITTVV